MIIYQHMQVNYFNYYFIQQPSSLIMTNIYLAFNNRLVDFSLTLSVRISVICNIVVMFIKVIITLPVINVMLMGLVWTIDGLVAQETDTFGVGNDLGFCRTPILCVKTNAHIFQGCHSFPMSAAKSLTHDLVETSMI